MREPVAREASGPDAIGEAARRLDRALTRLEKLVAGRAPGADLFEHDRSALAAELDAARARERALEEAAAAASQALGRAAAEVRLALGEDELGEDDSEDHEGADWDDPAAPEEQQAAGAEHTDEAAPGRPASDPHKDPAP